MNQGETISPVWPLTEVLEKELEALGEVVSKLTLRLTPIRAERPPQPSSEEPAAAPSSPLFEKLGAIRDTIINRRIRLETLLEEITL